MIFGSLFWILVILTLICVSFLFYGAKEESDDALTVGFIGGLIVLIFGWGLTGTTIELKTNEISTKCLVVVGPNSIFFTDKAGNLLYQSKDVREYNLNSNLKETTLIKVESFNLYGGEAEKVKYKLQDNPEKE